ncbi:MAG: hypothetical protein QXT26_07345 [Thermoproteota archaeon]
MGKLTEGLLGALGSILSSISSVIYDIVIFPLAATIHSTIKHIPIIGHTLVSTIDSWLARLSEDWPDKLP